MKNNDINKKTPNNHPMPFTRIEVVVLSVIDNCLQVLLAIRALAIHEAARTETASAWCQEPE